MRLFSLFLWLALGLGLLPGCTTVQQIDRANLARRIMQFEPQPNRQVLIDEFHSIREGAEGGTAQSTGGGCGCN